LGGEPRPWQIGVVFDEGRRLADQVIEALKSNPAVSVGVNQPYSPADRVYYTLARHGNRQGLPAAMIEMRNDAICDVEGQRKWAGKLADLFKAIAPSVSDAGYAAAPTIFARDRTAQGPNATGLNGGQSE
jgi:predicted N-formylglutamate amidohydrolase